MKKIAFGAVTLLGLTITSAAFGADYPVRRPVAAPVVQAVPVSPWDGWYVGFQIGEKWTKNDLTTDCIQGSGISPFNCGGHANPFKVDSSSPHSFDNSGLRTGFYLGANTQRGNWVYGLEGDWAYFNHSTTIPGLVGCSTFACNPALAERHRNGIPDRSLIGDSTGVENKWDASVRGRLGYVVMPSIMLYGTGGIAWQDTSVSMTCAKTTSFGCSLFNESEDKSRVLVGYTVGGGVEWMWRPNIVLRGEYRYSDFGDMDTGFFDRGIQFRSKVHVTSQMATFGIAYKFGFGGTGPN